MIVNKFRRSHSVYNSWQHLPCGDGRALLTTAVVWRQVEQEVVLIFEHIFIWKQEIRSVELGVCPMQLFFFIFDHVTLIQFKICCYVQNFIEIGWFFAEIWWYDDFQNGDRPPSWNCFTTIRDHPRSLLLAAAACQISCQSDTHIWRYSYLNFSHIWLEMPIQASKMGVLGDFGPLKLKRA